MVFKKLKTFSFKKGGELITLWVPTKVSEIIYWIRYWVGYLVLPSIYKRAIDSFNRVAWDEIKKIDEEMIQLVKQKKHLKVIKRQDK